MGKENKHSANKGRKFNIILTIVALILVLAVGGVTTYSWIEQSTNMDLSMQEGNIKDNPESYNSYYHKMTVGSDVDVNACLNLQNFADLADGFRLRQLSSSDGVNFFYEENNTVKALDMNDKSVSYINFDVDIQSSQSTTQETKFYFDSTILKFFYGTNESNVADAIRVAITTTVGDTTKTQIFAKSPNTYKAISGLSSNEEEDVTPIPFSSKSAANSPIFTLPGKGATAKMNIKIWLEGSVHTDDSKIAANELMKINFQINTNWYKDGNRYIFLYDGTAAGDLKSLENGTYTAYGEGDSIIGAENEKLVNLPDKNNQVKQTAIISEIKNVKKVVFKFNKTGTSNQTLSFTWYADGRTQNDFYYTVTGFTKDAE